MQHPKTPLYSFSISSPQHLSPTLSLSLSLLHHLIPTSSSSSPLSSNHITLYPIPHYFHSSISFLLYSPLHLSSFSYYSHIILYTIFFTGFLFLHCFINNHMFSSYTLLPYILFIYRYTYSVNHLYSLHHYIPYKHLSFLYTLNIISYNLYGLHITHMHITRI